MANIFPKGTNETVLKAGAVLSVVGALVTLAVWYYFTPKYSRVGYQPVQPVHFQHDIHVGQLGLDCRYCHSQVEVSGHSNLPPTQTCMQCHRAVQKDNPKLQPVRDSWATGQPIAWVKIHNVPDYAYFNHSAQINRGVSCVVSPVPSQPRKRRASHRRRHPRRPLSRLQSQVDPPGWHNSGSAGPETRP
jgi:hypothetical protein